MSPFLLLISINYSTQSDNDFVFFFFFYVAGRWNPWSRVSHQRFKDKAFKQTKRGKLYVGVKFVYGWIKFCLVSLCSLADGEQKKSSM